MAYIYFFFTLKNLKKLEISPQNFRYDVLHLLYSGTKKVNWKKGENKKDSFVLSSKKYTRGHP